MIAPQRSGADDFFARLAGHRYPLYGRGGRLVGDRAGTADLWTFCPMHESSGLHDPSLHIALIEEGSGGERVLTYCHVCNESAYRLIMNGALPECAAAYRERERDRDGSPGPGRRVAAIEIGDEEAYGLWCWQQDAEGFPAEVATYHYGDGAYAKVRWGDKAFAWYRRMGGRYVRGLFSAVPPLYGSDRLSGAGPLYAVEGERDADALHAAGIDAVSTHCFSTADKSCLAGREVVIIPDNDESGRQRARQFARLAAPAAASVRELAPLGAAPGYDVSDWLADGHDAAELAAFATGTAPASSPGTRMDTVSGVIIGVPVSAAPQDGAELLDELLLAFTKYVRFPSPEAAAAAVLWTAATHAQPSWEHATRLIIKSPERRCGKSRLLDLIEATCHSPLITVNISTAALVRCITEASPPTLLLDEADTIFGRKSADGHEDLRGIINAGHQRNRPYIRWDMTSRQAEACPTFAMAALASIGSLPDTIEDRGVGILMRRRAPGEEVSPFRTRRDRRPLGDLRSRLANWASGNAADLEAADPATPVEDRAADNWEPLLAVADLAGGAWPDLARKACMELSAGDASSDDGIGIRLLADLRVIFGSSTGMTTTAILDELVKLDESPWRATSYRDALDANRLATLLRPYGVHSVKARYGGGSAAPLAGYKVACSEARCKRPTCGLGDAWRRYLPDEDAGVPARQ